MFRRAFSRCSSAGFGTARGLTAGSKSVAASQATILGPISRIPGTRSVAHLRETVAQQVAGLVPEPDRRWVARERRSGGTYVVSGRSVIAMVLACHRVIMERWAEMEDPTALQLKQAEASLRAMEVRGVGRRRGGGQSVINGADEARCVSGAGGGSRVRAGRGAEGSRGAQVGRYR